jgi:hypothetical protein
MRQQNLGEAGVLLVMKNFEYYIPTKVIFGKDAEDQTGSLIKA